MKTPLRFWFDFSSPYSYIANEWVNALAARHGRTVRRHAILLGATALSAALGLLSLPPELSAITRAAAKLRKKKSFPRQDDEDAVIRCAMAHAWDAALPPIMRWIKK